MERIYIFLPSILILVCIAGATFFYLKWITKYFGNNFKSVEWHKNNQWKITWTVGTPLAIILEPAVEELIFRVPLIIAFNKVSSTAWYVIFASSGLFALAHWFGKKIMMDDIFFAHENGDRKSDDVITEMNRLHQKEGKTIIVYKVLHVVFTLPLGILTSYYSIKHQSIWVAFGIHSMWNLIMPAVFPLFALLGTLIFFGILLMRDKIR